MKRIILTQIQKKYHTHRSTRHSLASMMRSGFFGAHSDQAKAVLNIDNIAFKSGQIVGIVGKNGSGKTTLLRIIAGIYQPTKGSVTVHGHRVSLIGLRLGLRDRLTVEENIHLFKHLFGKTTPNAAAILRFAELLSYRHRYTYELSQGMLQRLTLAIALHCEPDILLLDEVLEGSDDEFRQKAYDRIRALAQNGATVLFTTHEPEVVKQLATRIITLENGRIVSDKRVK